MSIVFNNAPTKPAEPVKYPHLAKHKDSGNVYWKFDSTTGVKIVYSEGRRQAGDFAYNLVCDPAAWEILPNGTSFTFTQE